MTSAALIQVFEFLALLGAVLTAAKLVRTSLYRRYPFFFAYVLYLIPYNFSLFLLNVNSQFYQKFYVVNTVVFWFFDVLVVLELYRLILERHKGLFTVGRWAMYLGIIVSVGLSVLSLLPHIAPAAGQRSVVMPYLQAIDQGVNFSLAIFLLIVLFLLSMYPVSLSRNVVVHAAVCTVLFLTGTLGVILYRIFDLHLSMAIDLGLMGISSACLLAWFFLLSPLGEQAHVSMPWMGPEEESRLLLHLDALNSTLLKASKN
jgi:hypothetical protein